MSRLRRALARTSSSGNSTFIIGAAGIGKSRLVTETISAAHESDITVLRGRPGMIGPPVPYRPIAEAVLSLARDSPVPETPALAPYRAVLGTLVPEWRTTDAGGAAGTAPVSPVVLAEAVLRLVAATGSANGSLLVIEDLHDADPETLAVVEYLADNLESRTVSLLATVRDEQNVALDLVRALADRTGAAEIELHALSRAESDELVAQCLRVDVAGLPEGLTAQLWEDGAGNPFLIEELLRHMVASGRLEAAGDTWQHNAATTTATTAAEVPDTLVRRIAQRAQRLGGQGVEVLTAAAVLGRRFPVPVLQQVTGLDDHEVLAHLRAALSAQLVAPDETERDWYAFRNGLTADAVLAILPAARRTRLSQEAAEVVARLHPGLPGAWCQFAARLRAEAGDVGGSALLHLVAGQRALQAGAARSAVRLLESAQELLGPAPATASKAEEMMRAEVLTVLLYALAESGEFERAFELTERLEDAGQGSHQRAAVALRLAWVAQVAGRLDAARTQLRTARSLLDQDPAPGPMAELAAVDAYVTVAHPGEQAVPRAEAMAREALALAEGRNRPDVEAQAWHLLGKVARHPHESEHCFRQTRRIAEQARLPIWRLYAALGSACNAWLADGDVEGVRQTRDQAIEAGTMPMVRCAEGIEALHHVLRGDLAGGERIVSAELASIGPQQLDGVLRHLLMVQAVIAAHRLDRPAMEATLAEFTEVGGDPTPVGPLAVGLARVFCALLEEDRRLALKETALVREPRLPDYSLMGLAGHHGLGLLLEELDEPGSAELTAPDPAGAMHWNRQFVLLASAVRHGRAGGTAAAQTAVAEASEIGRCYPLAHHLGLRLVGESAVRDGWADAEGWLRDAEAYFHASEVPAVASACRGLLRESGASVRQRREGTERVPVHLRTLGVTVREYDVLVELGHHLGNKGVAARLHISPRTVEKHVASLMLKTEAPDRATLLDHLDTGAPERRDPVRA